MVQSPFSFILSRRSLSTIRPWTIALLLLMLGAKDGHAQNFTLAVAPTSGSCGLSNGAITVSVVSTAPGIVPPFTFYLIPPVGLPLVQASGVFTGLGTGTYGIEVVDANGVTSTVQYYPIYVSTAPQI